MYRAVPIESRSKPGDLAFAAGPTRHFFEFCDTDTSDSDSTAVRCTYGVSCTVENNLTTHGTIRRKTPRSIVVYNRGRRKRLLRCRHERWDTRRIVIRSIVSLTKRAIGWRGHANAQSETAERTSKELRTKLLPNRDKKASGRCGFWSCCPSSAFDTNQFHRSSASHVYKHASRLV